MNKIINQLISSVIFAGAATVSGYATAAPQNDETQEGLWTNKPSPTPESRRIDAIALARQKFAYDKKFIELLAQEAEVTAKKAEGGTIADPVMCLMARVSSADGKTGADRFREDFVRAVTQLEKLGDINAEKKAQEIENFEPTLTSFAKSLQIIRSACVLPKNGLGI